MGVDFVQPIGVEEVLTIIKVQRTHKLQENVAVAS